MREFLVFGSVPLTVLAVAIAIASIYFAVEAAVMVCRPRRFSRSIPPPIRLPFMASRRS